MLENIKGMFIKEEWLIYIWNLIPVLLIVIMVIVCIIGIIGFTIDYFGDMRRERQLQIEARKLKEDDEFRSIESMELEAENYFCKLRYDDNLDIEEAKRLTEEKYPDIGVSYEVEIYGELFYHKRRDEVKRRVLENENC